MSQPESSMHVGNYSLLYKLGAGSFAEVFMGMHDIVSKPVAIKHINKSRITRQKDQIRIVREMEIMKTVVHQYITELFEIIEDETSFWLVMELAPNGSLKNMIQTGVPMDEAECRRIFVQIVQGLGYLHTQCNIIHRDLKAENVLFDERNNVRLIDFGLSSMFETGVYKTACGSPVYTAPEVIKRVSYGKSADIWSLGVLLYLMATGQFPFEDESMPKLLHKVTHEPVPVPQGVSKELRDLLQKLLQKQPEMRIDITEIFDHPWIACAYPLSERKRRMLFKSCISEDFMDRQIVEELEALNVDTHELREFLIRGKYNALTAMYRIKRRAKAIDEFNTRQHEEETTFVRRASFPSTHAVELHQGILEKASQRLFAKNKVSVAFKRQLTSANARLNIRPVLRRERSHSPNRK